MEEGLDHRAYIRLLDILYRVVQSLKGEPLDAKGRYRQAEGLATKHFQHAASVLYLSRGTLVTDCPSIDINFGDTASVPVLVRAALEAFLMFHYIFVSSRSDEELEFRHDAWQLAGLMRRQRFPVSSTEGKAKIQEESIAVEGLRKTLKSNPVFQKLNSRQQKNVTEGNFQWVRPSWRLIAKDAKLADIYADTIYGMLAAYAHSDYLSVIQILDADTREKQQEMIETYLRIVQIAMANVTASYCDLFPKAKEVLVADKGGEHLVRLWVEIGRKTAAPVDQ